MCWCIGVRLQLAGGSECLKARCAALGLEIIVLSCDMAARGSSSSRRSESLQPGSID